MGLVMRPRGGLKRRQWAVFFFLLLHLVGVDVGSQSEDETGQGGEPEGSDGSYSLSSLVGSFVIIIVVLCL